MSPRTIVVTGAARGIGASATKELRAQGNQVIGVDLDDADIIADLSTAQGRSAAVDAIGSRVDGELSGIVACAGLASPDASAMVAVNYFGTIAVLEGLNPLLASATNARALAISSSSVMHHHDEALVEACLLGDEARAKYVATTNSRIAYASTKVALSRWIRRTAILPQWAGVGILLNAVAPGTVVTRITQPILATEAGRAMLAEATPIATRAYAEPSDIAPLLAFFVSPACNYIVGQTIFADGGSDAILRAERLP